jgi:hypothetical protein
VVDQRWQASAYTRRTVDDFLAAAATERDRLRAEIAAAEARERRARASLGVHRVMLSMFLETQREIAKIRADAEAEAEHVVAASAGARPARGRAVGDDEFLAYLRDVKVDE